MVLSKISMHLLQPLLLYERSWSIAKNGGQIRRSGFKRRLASCPLSGRLCWLDSIPDYRFKADQPFPLRSMLNNFDEVSDVLRGTAYESLLWLIVGVLCDNIQTALNSRLVQSDNLRKDIIADEVVILCHFLPVFCAGPLYQGRCT